MSKILDKQNGFGHLEVILVILVIFIIGAIGYSVFINKKSDASKNTTAAANTLVGYTKIINAANGHGITASACKTYSNGIYKTELFFTKKSATPAYYYAYQVYSTNPTNTNPITLQESNKYYAGTTALYYLNLSAADGDNVTVKIGPSATDPYLGASTTAFINRTVTGYPSFSLNRLKVCPS